MIRTTLKICLPALIFAAAAAFAQRPPVEARIAGLESNAEYMSLLEEDARLQFREDSVARVIEDLRRELRENPAAGRAHSDEILQLENCIFELRNAKGRLIDRINTIEQEWVLANLDGSVPAPAAAHAQRDGVPTVPEALRRRNLVDNPCFADELPAADYAALRRAQAFEGAAEECFDRYRANHAALGELAEAYAAAGTEPEALEIHDRFRALDALNRTLADSLGATWNYVFDNKNYAYGYLLDKFGQDELLAREEERLAEAARTLSALGEGSVSEPVADYVLRKRVLLDYEAEVAGLLGLEAARDSLRGVAAGFRTTEFRLPRHEIRERYFLDFDSVAFSSTPRYTYQNPIPECTVYAHGTIYRILLGTFNTKRAAATFRGAYPLSYLIDEAGKWNYYTGGFATRAEAEAAQQLCRQRGFIRPEIVVWNDGCMRNVSREGDRAPAGYRVEIMGADTLDEALRAAIAAAAGAEVDISRAGRMFVVGNFDDRAVADRVADAVRRTDGTWEVKVAEIAE